MGQNKRSFIYFYATDILFLAEQEMRKIYNQGD